MRPIFFFKNLERIHGSNLKQPHQSAILRIHTFLPFCFFPSSFRSGYRLKEPSSQTQF